MLYDALTPAMVASHGLGGPTLEGLLLARHRVIDALLADAIEAGGVSQVVELACGMSPRGWRFGERYGDRVTYVEADLPQMARRKARALERMGAQSRRHRVVEADVLRDDGALSLAAVCSTLDREGRLAIVTEGLLTYFDDTEVIGMWRRFARELGRFDGGLYVSDLRLAGAHGGAFDRAFFAVLASFVGRSVHAHFDGESTAVASLEEAGFARATLHRADRHSAAGDAAADPAAERIRVVEATV